MDSISHPHPQNLPPQPPSSQPFVVKLGDESSEDSFDFWGVLSRRKWLVFLGLAVGLGLGVLWHAQSEEIYSSESHIKIEPKTPVFMNYTRTPVMDPGGEAMNYRHDRFIGRINIIDECVKNYKLASLSSFEEMQQEDIPKSIAANLEIVPDRQQPFIYELSYTSTNEEDCQIVLNNLVNSYREHLEKSYGDQSETYIKVLREVRRNFEDNYKRLNRDYIELIETNPAPAVNASGMNIYEQNLFLLSKRIKEWQDRMKDILAGRERVQLAIQQGDEAMNNMVWVLYQTGRIKIDEDRFRGSNSDEAVRQRQLADKQTQYEILRSTMGEGHPTMKTLRQEISLIQQQLATSVEESKEKSLGYIDLDKRILLERYLVRSEQELADFRAKIEKDTIDQGMNQQKANEIAVLKMKIEAVETEKNQVQELLQTAERKIAEIDPKRELQTSPEQQGFLFEVLMSAELGEKIWPILPVILGIAGLIGSLCGFGLACLVEIADKTFHNPDEIMKQLSLPLIGHIPVISQSKRYLVEDTLIEPAVCTFHRPKSQVSEAFRAVRTAIYFNSQGQQHQVIQVTSPTPGDGKSTLAANLAVSIAQSGKRVLLVDADMRRPRQHLMFGITVQEGFATVLSGQSDWREAIFPCEEVEGLSLLPCGLKPNNPAELCTSPQVKELIEEMREEYDFVIIDTPPLLAVTDACPIAARVDGVVLTLRIKKNVRISAERATEVLRNVGASVVGVVVNGVGAQTGYGSQYTYGAYRAGYAYNGYGYGYGYGYGQGGKYYEDDKKPQPARIEAPAESATAE